MPFTENSIPDQSGRVAIVTGANSGLGLETARELARAGAKVIMACRNEQKATAALGQIKRHVPGGDVRFMRLDLGDLSSVRAFVDAFQQDYDRLDLLINNAGIMAPPRQLTKDGFEMQLGVNHLGHFALTGLLMPLLLKTEGARVTNVSSVAHKTGRIFFSNLMGEKSYNRWAWYGQSKLANLLFTLELQKRLKAAGHAMLVTAAHPGWAATNLQTEGPTQGFIGKLTTPFMKLGNAVVAQSALMGALPTLYAATGPDVAGNTYMGPGGPGEVRGYPKPVGRTKAAQDEKVAARLWEVSEDLTGVSFAL